MPVEAIDESTPKKILPMWAVAAGVAVFGFFFQIGLQYGMRPHAIDGVYYQEWSSETMMQTVSIADLRDAPFESLWNIHMQPPGLDIIRAFLASLSDATDDQILLRDVDRSLYMLWAVLFGLMGALIYWWLSHMTPWPYAALGAAVFLFHPAAIFYSSFLDATFLSALLILWMYYCLWQLRRNPEQSIMLFTVATLLLFFTRSLFQWPAIIWFTCSLFLISVPFRRTILFLVICGSVAGLFTAKQYYRFDTVRTFGWAGLNLCRGIDVTEPYNMLAYWEYIEKVPDFDDKGSVPRVLVRKKKLTGMPNFNHLAYLPLNKKIMNHFWQQLPKISLTDLLASYSKNLAIYLKPSSRYITGHVIIDRIPWRGVYERIFSFPVLPGLALVAIISWVIRARKKDLLSAVGLALPALYVFLACVMGEQGENMRLKFFLEPVLFVFIAYQLYRVGRRLAGLGRRALRTADSH